MGELGKPIIDRNFYIELLISLVGGGRRGVLKLIMRFKKCAVNRFFTKIMMMMAS